MVLLVAINLLTGSPYWVLWVLLGWGTGILSHWFEVLGLLCAAGAPDGCWARPTMADHISIAAKIGSTHNRRIASLSMRPFMPSPWIVAGPKEATGRT